MTHPLDGPPFCIVQTGKQKSLDLARAVMDGRPGGAVHMGEIDAADVPDHMTPVVIGVHRETIETLRALRRNRRPFVTVDNGYFRPYKEGGYFRATSNALQWLASRRGVGVGRDIDCSEIGRARFEALGLHISPWRTENRSGHILLALQSPLWFEMMGQNSEHWVSSIAQRIAAYDPARSVVVRRKPLKGVGVQPPLEEHLSGAWAVIAYSSAVLLKAAMAGIPICSIAYSAASPMGCCTVDSLMLGPIFRERESILHTLAANQWTLDEFRSGEMWRALQDRYEPEFLSLA